MGGVGKGRAGLSGGAVARGTKTGARVCRRLIPELPSCTFFSSRKPKTRCVESTHEQTLRYPILASPPHPDVRHQRLPVSDASPGAERGSLKLLTPPLETGHKRSRKRFGLRPGRGTHDPASLAPHAHRRNLPEILPGLCSDNGLGEQRVHLVTGRPVCNTLCGAQGLRPMRSDSSNATAPCSPAACPGNPLESLSLQVLKRHLRARIAICYPPSCLLLGIAGRFPTKTGAGSVVCG